MIPNIGSDLQAAWIDRFHCCCSWSFNLFFEFILCWLSDCANYAFDFDGIEWLRDRWQDAILTIGALLLAR